MRFPISFLPEVPPDELERFPVCCPDGLRLASGKPVAGAGHRDQLVRDAVAFQFLRHGRGEPVGHIGVFGAVDQQGRRIGPRDVPHRTVGIQPALLFSTSCPNPGKNMGWTDWMYGHSWVAPKRRYPQRPTRKVR
jgi:hypothetical protein